MNNNSNEYEIVVKVDRKKGTYRLCYVDKEGRQIVSVDVDRCEEHVHIRLNSLGDCAEMILHREVSIHLADLIMQATAPNQEGKPKPRKRTVK